MVTRSYQICTKTVMDTSDPEISFNEDGISNHAVNFTQKIEPKWQEMKSNDWQLRNQLDKIKSEGKGKDFDCIIGMSGGLDSSFMLHKVVTEYGLRPLVFHVDAGWNSEVAVHNINQLVDALNLDLYTEVINWEDLREFQLAMFKSGVPHLDTPQDMAFISVLYRFAEKYNIKYILNGGNISTECVLMPLRIIYWGSDLAQYKDILSKHASRKLDSYPFIDIFYHKLYLRYMKNIRVVKPLNYMEYTRKAAIAELELMYGFKPYKQKHFESRFTRFFEGYWLPTRFGYDMRRNQFSSLILTGQMTREEALQQLESPPLTPEEEAIDFEFVSSKLNLTPFDLKELHSLPLSYYWDYKNRKTIFEIGERVLSAISGTQRGGAI